MPLALIRLAVISAALGLVACGGAEAEADTLPASTPTSPVTSQGDAASISATDLRQLSPEQMLTRLTNDMTVISEQVADPRDAGELDSDLMRLEEIGTDYRTIALRFEREIEAGDETYQKALSASRAELVAARDVLTARRDALIAAYPDEARSVREAFDKFDFGFLG